MRSPDPIRQRRSGRQEVECRAAWIGQGMTEPRFNGLDARGFSKSGTAGRRPRRSLQAQMHEEKVV